MDEVLDARCVVLPDTHGHYDLVSRAVDTEAERCNLFIFAGDVVDGPDTARLIDLITQLGSKAVTIVGIHEWVLRNALSDSQNPAVEVWREQIWPGYEDNLLESYGVNRTGCLNRDAHALRDALAARGHLDWLTTLPAYAAFEQFVVVHAGPSLDTSWVEQAEYLDGISAAEGRLLDEPPQVFDHELSLPRKVPPDVDERKFITGHSHLPNHIAGRQIGNRVCLASALDRGHPLFYWRSYSSEIVACNQS